MTETVSNCASTLSLPPPLPTKKSFASAPLQSQKCNGSFQKRGISHAFAFTWSTRNQSYYDLYYNSEIMEIFNVACCFGIIFKYLSVITFKDLPVLSHEAT